MGAEPYWYFVDYTPDYERALHDLREREFLAGRYNPVIDHIDFPLDENSPCPRRKHKSIQAALDASDAEGTRSILDIEMIGTQPDYGVASPLNPDLLQDLYGTCQPTHDMVEDNLDFVEEIERGQCVYFIIYKDGKSHEIIFAGYSFD